MQQTQIANEFTQYVDKPIDTQQIERTIDDLQGTGLYSSISYNLIDKDEKTGLLIRPRMKDYGPPFLNVGLFLSSNNVTISSLGWARGRRFLVWRAGVGVARGCVGWAVGGH